MLYLVREGVPSQISNVEFMLLQIISQAGEISGYKINKLVRERQYHIWAGIGSTSIYTGLEKLKRKGFVSSRLDVGKQGKGPVPKKFRLTQKGKVALRKEILRALSSTRERDFRFDLGIAAIPRVDSEEAKNALQKRRRFLEEVAEHVRTRLESLGGENLPLHIKALFKHSLHLIKHELEFVDVLLVDLKKAKRRKV